MSHDSDKRVQKLRFLARVVFQKKFYIAINKIFETPHKLDATLSTVCYASLFVSEVLKKINSKRGQLISAKLKLLSSYLSDVRIFNRMWALFGLLPWAIDTVGKSKGGPLTSIHIFQAVTGVLLQLFENVGFVGDHHFTTQSDKLTYWFNIWCCRLWAGYVVSDLAMNYVEYRASPKMRPSLRRSVISNLGNLPLTVHWSLDKGCLSPLLVGLCGTMSSIARTRFYWQEAWSEVLGMEQSFSS